MKDIVGRVVQKARLHFAILLIGISILPQVTTAQDLRFDRDRGRRMLDAISRDLKKVYYDPAFRGMDVEARFAAADQKIGEAQALGQVFAIIAQVLLDLDDAHTLFLPPSRAQRHQLGWEMSMVGDKCYVTGVMPGSDAEKKGLRPGDHLQSVGGYAPDRGSLWKIKYLFYMVRPPAALTVVAASPGKPPRTLEVAARITPRKRILDLTDAEGTDYWAIVREAQNEARLRDHRYVEVGQDVLVWNMPAFDVSPDALNGFMKKARARKGLVIDMRGNGGGRLDLLEQVVGRVFDRDVKLADLKGRRGAKPLVAKGSGKNAFAGKLVVLVDSGSASAAEMFARILQIEKRGTVVGDRTAGAVMQSVVKSYSTGVDTQVFYGASLTTADVIMSDGQSLEGKGVVPDELRLPDAAALAQGHDPVLAKALELVGLAMTPAEAGALFPVQWEPGR